MEKRISAALAMGLFFVPLGLAKDKAKSMLPPYVLRARTVAVIIDPDAGETITDPRADEVAQKDVETALLNWGRFQPVIGTQGSDLIIVVRRGHGRLVNQTISNPRQSNRAGTIDPMNSGVMIGAQHGRQPSLSDSSSTGSVEESPHPKTEIGGSEDSFTVYEGNVETPLDARPAWRFVGKDGLRPHAVPAVAEFRKVLAEADKAAAEANKAATKKP